MMNPEGEITVQVDVKNTGTLAGMKWFSFTSRHMNSEVKRPDIELKGFERVSLLPGEVKTVKIVLKAADLAYWNEKSHAFVVEEDKVMIMVGSSSGNIKFTKRSG